MIRRQYGDFSMDQGATANFEYPFAICRLPAYLSASCQERRPWKITDVSICSCRSPIYVEFLTFSQSRN
jgi:hypothetical protein